MSDFAPDFGVALHDGGRGGASVSFSCVLLPHIGRVEADAFCSTGNLSLESEFAVTFDFDRVALYQLLALLPTVAGTALGGRLSTPFEEPENIEFSSPIAVGVDAVVGPQIENENERYSPLQVRSFRPADATTRIDVPDAPVRGGGRRRGQKST